MSVPDERPIIVCRIESPPRMRQSVDDWMPKHFDDSLDHDAVTSVAAYRVVRDFDPESGLPWLFNGHGNRFIVYVADTLPGLIEWVDSPMLRDAIDDGVERESSFPALDDEPFTGNTYSVTAVRGGSGTDFVGDGTAAVFVERFEVGPADAAAFDEWLDGSHLDAVAALPGVRRVRTFRQDRTAVPSRFPYDRYVSKGSRMLWAELGDGEDVRAWVRDGDVRAAIEDSLRWDLRLPYVRRELAEGYVLRDREDAKATFVERKAADAAEKASRA